MDLKTYNKIFRCLQSETKSLGYSLEYTTSHNRISCSLKIIYMKYFIHTIENLYAFCHELGHAREKNPRDDLYKKYKFFRVYSEITAWLLGYKFVKKYKLPRVGYFKSAIIHLKTYVKVKHVKKNKS